jgi:hypothetical protein
MAFDIGIIDWKVGLRKGFESGFASFDSFGMSCFFEEKSEKSFNAMSFLLQLIRSEEALKEAFEGSWTL